MEAFGLPASFGKPQAQETPVAGPSKTDGGGSSRGGASGRGDRGVVGGGKRNKRGRGRGGDTAVNVGDRTGETTATPISGWDRTGGLASQYDAFNGGVKVRRCH